MKILVTGGIRSGKSFHAESLVVAEPLVTYVAPGPPADPDTDPVWAARVLEHQARRPSNWITCESHDLADAIANAEGAVLVDGLSDWVAWQIGELDGWDAVREEWEPVFQRRVDEAADALSAREGTVVIVSQEAGMGGEPDDLRAKVFRELIGTANQRLALECDQVMLVVAGRALVL